MGEIEGFASALSCLADGEQTVDPGTLYRLSSPGDAEMEQWHAMWPSLDPTVKRDVARQLLATSRADFQVDFTPQFTAMLDDPEPDVRALGIDGLWERQDLPLMRRLVTMLETDSGAVVRARSAAALGRYVELGQLDKLDTAAADSALAALVDAASDDSEDTEVRRRALESAGYADDPAVSALIDEAIESHERTLRAGALRAMGNSADDRWAGEVVAHLEGDLPELQVEAAHAAGELVIAEAVPMLIALACGDDRAAQIESIWALGEIGGRDARRALEGLLDELDGDDQLDALEDALATLQLSEGELPWSGADDEAFIEP